MMTVYKTMDGSMKVVQQIEEGVWVSLINPSPAEIEKIAFEYDIEINHLRAPLDEEERARIEVEDNYTLILVDIPIVDTKDEREYHTTIPLAIILTETIIFSVCLKDNKVLCDFTEGRVKNFYTQKKTRFILQILYKNSTYFLQYLRFIDKKSNEIERKLHLSTKNKELIELLELEKTLVYFTTSLRANEVVLEKMLRIEKIKQYSEDKELLEDVIIENKQAIEMADIYSGILSGTMDAFASIISNNLNISMKVMTSVTSVLAIPTMIASFFGMNFVNIPFGDSPYAFFLTIIMSFGVAILMALIMIKKKLF